MFLYKEVLTSSQVLSSECQREFSQMNLTFSPKRRFASNKRCISFEVHHAGWSTISKIWTEEIGRFLIDNTPLYIACSLVFRSSVLQFSARKPAIPSRVPQALQTEAGWV